MKNQKEVIDFIGKETVLKFDYASDNIATFKTCIAEKILYMKWHYFLRRV